MDEVELSEDTLTIMPLGAGREVGRSCIVLKYRGHTIMFDCGVHPGYMDNSGLPFFDAIDPATIDLLLITHFHIDHCAAVPWFLMQTGFRGKCYMTHATKGIFKILLADYVRVAGGSSDQSLFNKIDLDSCLPLISEANYHQVITYNGIKISCYNAGHVFGACMWLVDIDGVRVMYTGDFSLEDERHLKGAEIPAISPDVLIVESTHGVSKNEGRVDREFRFIQCVTRIVERGGRALIPIFALGRVQELLIILEEHWAAHPELHKIPIHYGSNLAKKSMSVYNNFRAGMADGPMVGKSRFDFNHIQHLRTSEELDDSFPCVVLAAPAMLQSGMSRILFDKWASNPLNGVIIPGYVVDNTLAKTLFNEPSTVQTLAGQTIPRKITVNTISFSGHSDCPHTTQFIEALKTKRVVLVHGVAQEMDRLKHRLIKDLAHLDIEVYTPGDCEAVNFEFKSNPTASVTGSLLETLGEGHERLAGLIVRKDFAHMVVAPAELGAYSTLRTLGVSLKQQVPLARPLKDFLPFLRRQFEGVEYLAEGGVVMIGASLKIEEREESASIEWRSDPMTDLAADNVAMMLTCTKPKEDEEDTHELFARKLEIALQARWGDVVALDVEAQMFQFSLGGEDVLIVIDPDSPNGVTIECTRPETEQTISRLAEKLWGVSQPMVLPKA
jgi:cleavage and polyadenylation specificity factor subunit 3